AHARAQRHQDRRSEQRLLRGRSLHAAVGCGRGEVPQGGGEAALIKLQASQRGNGDNVIARYFCYRRRKSSSRAMKSLGRRRARAISTASRPRGSLIEGSAPALIRRSSALSRLSRAAEKIGVSP